MQERRTPVFTKADDLQQIKGIGPAIVEGLRPWLTFEDLPRDGNVPSAR
jgi:DNA uptake protein ComE-like DNA-binding protein